MFAFGAGAGYAQTDSGSGSADGAGEGVSLPPSDDTALLRALHASPDAPAVDVYVDGEQVAQGVEFANITGYLELEPGERDVQVYPSEDGGEGATGAENETTETELGAGNDTGTENATGLNATNETGTENATGLNATNETGTENATGLNATNETDAGTETGSTAQTPSGEAVIDETVTVQGGQSYTLAAINQLDDIEALVLEDEPEDDQAQDEESNTALVRAVHLSPDADTVKVRADSYVVAGALEYEEASKYGDVQTGTSQVEVLPTDSADPLSMANYEFEAGERYNLFLVGMVEPEAAAAQGGLGAQTGNQTGASNETTTEPEGLSNETTETELGTGNDTGVNATNDTGVNATNETGLNATNETGLNATNETGVENETGLNATNETGVNATNETGVNATNETGVENETGLNATNETGVENETTTESGAGAMNETTTEAGAGGSQDQSQPEGFRILGVQDSSGSVLEEVEEEATPSADDLLPIDLGGDSGSDGNATAENDTATNGTSENGTVANETTGNVTAANGTVTEANTTNTSD